MGCGCGGSRKSAASSQGTVPANPLIFGQDDESLPIKRVVVVQASGGLPAGATRYVRGSEVDTLIASGALRSTGG